MPGPITPEWLKSCGIYPHDKEPPVEFAVRIRGGTDDGFKTSTDEDADGDEISDLMIELVPGESWVRVWVELYHLPDLNTVGLVELGVRHTRDEILELCRALKAWGVTPYP